MHRRECLGLSFLSTVDRTGTKEGKRGRCGEEEEKGRRKKEEIRKKNEERRKKKSTKMLEEVGNRQEFEHTEDIVQWRSIIQKGRNDNWKALCRKMEENVLEKFKVDEAKKGPYKVGGEPPEWRIVKREKTQTCGKRLLGENLLTGSQNTVCSETTACRQEKQESKRSGSSSNA